MAETRYRGRQWNPFWDLAARDASLGVGHIWTAVKCPAYNTLNPVDCICGKEA